MNKPSYKTDHPTIKEITIGEQFVTNDGTTVQFVSYIQKITEFVFQFKLVDTNAIDSLQWRYKKSLKYSYQGTIHKNDIKAKYISLKDKIDAL
jgi:hypothetical protein